jgi:hypothetical protein
MRVNFALVAGTLYQTTPDSWNVGNFLATSNQSNLSALDTHVFRIADVRLIKGNTNQTFFLRDRMTELALCQRYYQKSYNQGVDPGTITSVGAWTFRSGSTDTENTQLQRVLPVSMRSTPTVVWYSDVTGASGNIRNRQTSADISVSSTVDSGQASSGYPSTGASFGGQDKGSAHATLAAEL